MVNKPSGLLTQSAAAGDDNLVDRGREYLRDKYNKQGNVYMGLVHRLDRLTTGVVVLARTSKAASRLSKSFRERSVRKLYVAIVDGTTAAQGELKHQLAPDGYGVKVVASSGKAAHLRFLTLAHSRDPTRSGGQSLVLVELLTGRKHQIRAQFATCGHGLVGDPRYGRDRQSDTMALHAAHVVVEHPVRKSELTLSAPPPKSFWARWGGAQVSDENLSARFCLTAF